MSYLIFVLLVLLLSLIYYSNYDFDAIVKDDTQDELENENKSVLDLEDSVERRVIIVTACVYLISSITYGPKC